MNGKLSDYFSKMKNAEPTEPLLSKDEARNMLEGIDNSQSTTKNNNDN